jgi:purine-nucleoside/S-methyl-5'-thioadenosine phosphorylase / adenosine deaminase
MSGETVSSGTAPGSALDPGAPFAWRGKDDVPWLEASLPGARAVFSTRLGGVSEGPYRSLNLGILTDDARERIGANRERLATALGRDAAGIAMGLQVHGTAVEVRAGPEDSSAYSDPRAARLREADAQVTRSAEVTPLVLVADCVPLVLTAGGAAVAAVHCGWRGIAAGLVDRALEALSGLADCEPADAAAAIGPGVGPCCYSVGGEVRQAFQERGHGEDVLGGGRLDLALAVRRDLERIGVPRDRIAASGICTSCNPELFFSHRRDGGVTGRQAGLAWLDS